MADPTGPPPPAEPTAPDVLVRVVALDGPTTRRYLFERNLFAPGWHPITTTARGDQQQSWAWEQILLLGIVEILRPTPAAAQTWWTDSHGTPLGVEHAADLRHVRFIIGATEFDATPASARSIAARALELADQQLRGRGDVPAHVEVGERLHIDGTEGVRHG